MKLLRYISFAAVATLLMAADCSNKDSEFYNDVFISGPSVVTIEPSGSFDLGSEFYVQAVFSRFITEGNQNTPLDLFKTSGANRFDFSFLIEKEVADGQWELVSPVVEQQQGASESGDFVFAHAVLNPNENEYEFRTAIQLNDAGNFRLSFGYDGLPSKTVILRSDSADGNLFVNMYTLCEDVDSAGYYYYTVNE